MTRFLSALLLASLMGLSSCSSPKKVDVQTINNEYDQQVSRENQKLVGATYEELKARLERQKLDNRQLLIEMQNLKEKMVELEKLQDNPPPPQPGPVTGTPVYDPTTLYKMGYKAVKEKRHEEARSLFESFLREYPKNQFSDNCLYWIGETYYDQKDYKTALHYFHRTEGEYPNANKVPDAILKSGYAYYSLGRMGDARKELNRLLTEFPETSLRSLAEGMLGKISSK